MMSFHGQWNLFLQLLVLEVESLLVPDLRSFGRVLLVSRVLVLEVDMLDGGVSRPSDITSILNSAYWPSRLFTGPRRISCSRNILLVKCAIAGLT